ncbi:hypothetical protein T492DRAFT_492957 [Pavlovales sp. CCMP2436]|nr:hypothetical protein T492DRAFT_492957 [Pavlovales sp. CCMP2436]
MEEETQERLVGMEAAVAREEVLRAQLQELELDLLAADSELSEFSERCALLESEVAAGRGERAAAAANLDVLAQRCASLEAGAEAGKREREAAGEEVRALGVSCALWRADAKAGRKETGAAEAEVARLTERCARLERMGREDRQVRGVAEADVARLAELLEAVGREGRRAGLAAEAELAVLAERCVQLEGVGRKGREAAGAEVARLCDELNIVRQTREIASAARSGRSRSGGSPGEFGGSLGEFGGSPVLFWGSLLRGGSPGELGDGLGMSASPGLPPGLTTASPGLTTASPGRIDGLSPVGSPAVYGGSPGGYELELLRQTREIASAARSGKSGGSPVFYRGSPVVYKGRGTESSAPRDSVAPRGWLEGAAAYAPGEAAGGAGSPAGRPDNPRGAADGWWQEANAGPTDHQTPALISWKSPGLSLGSPDSPRPGLSSRTPGLESRYFTALCSTLTPQLMPQRRIPLGAVSGNTGAFVSTRGLFGGASKLNATQPLTGRTDAH